MRVLFTLFLLSFLINNLSAQTVTICLDAETECGLPIGDVIYHVDPSPPGIPDVLPCQTYPSDNELTITAEKDINHLNGVSTYDMVLIAKHILNTQLLDSPYKLIAADVSNSGTVSAIDLVVIRKLILFQMTEFPNNTSWRFIASDYVFPDPDNPWGSGPSACTIPAGTTGTFEKSYIGIKIGDVNKSAVSNDSLIVNESDTRNVASFNIIEKTFDEGELVTVDFYKEDLDQLAGFQFSLAYDKESLDYRKLLSGSLKYLDDACLGLSDLDNGIIHMSWVNMEMDSDENTSEPLFSLEFVAQKPGNLSELITFNTAKLKPELYTQDLEAFELNLQFSKEDQERVKVISSPNPFHEELTLTFESKDVGLAELRILDLKGSLIKTIRQTIEPGENKMILNEDFFPATGVYFFELKIGEQIQSGQLIKQ